MVENLVLGWRVSPGLEPRYWLNVDAKPGSQPDGELVRVPADRLNTHMVIVAQSGSGKSFFLGRLIEELVLRTKARCIVLDPNGDFTRVHEVKDARMWEQARYDPKKGQGALPDESSREKFETEWSRLLITIMKGELQAEAKRPYEQIQLWWPSLSAELVGEDVDSAMRSELYHCHAFMQAVGGVIVYQDALTGKSEDLFETAEAFYKDWLDRKDRTLPVRRELALRDMQARFNDLLAHIEHDDLGRYVQSRIEAFFQDAVSALEYVSEEAMRLYWGKVRMYRASPILATHPLAEHALTERILVVDLPSLRDKRTRLLAINAILTREWEMARREWEHALDHPPEEDERFPTFIVMEEAHNLIPAEPSGTAEAALREQFRTIVAEGRKYGLFLVLVSQRPDKLDPMILSECDNKTLMRLDSEATLDLARERLGLSYVPARLLGKCLEFGVGRVLITGRWVSEEPQLLYCAARRTIEGGRNLRAEFWARPCTDP